MDIIATVINQKRFIACLERMEEIDRKLSNENIYINYKNIQHLSFKLIVLSSVRILTLVMATIIIFPMDAAPLLGVFIPIYISTFSKIWFVIIVMNVREKFNAINSYMEMLSERIRTQKDADQMNNTSTYNANLLLDSLQSNDKNEISIISSGFGYLHKEIAPKRLRRNFIRDHLSSRKKLANVKIVKPFLTDEMHNETTGAQILFFQNFLQRKSNDGLVINDKFDNKLTNLCKIHDDICEVAKRVNNMFSFQMLALMAYGFIYITAQLYFVYCGLVGQVFFLLLFHVDFHRVTCSCKGILIRSEIETKIKLMNIS